MRILRLLLVMTAAAANATEYHVAPTGDDTHPGTNAKPLKTIQAAADKAQPGDVITVHEGIYRERVNPPRGGTSDTNRITYQAAPGGKVVVTGAEPLKGWTHVTNDTWKVKVPNAFFGEFNPFNEWIHGEWCRSGPRRGVLYLDGEWFDEAKSKGAVLQPVEKDPVWFVEVGGTEMAPEHPYLYGIKKLRVGDRDLPVEGFADKKPGSPVRATPSEDHDGQCLGWTRPEDWVTYAKVDLSQPQTVVVQAGALGEGGVIEFHSDPGTAEAEHLGSVTVTQTGGWQTWQSFSAPLRASSFGGARTLALVFKPPRQAGGAERAFGLRSLQIGEQAIVMDRLSSKSEGGKARVAPGAAGARILDIASGDWIGFAGVDTGTGRVYLEVSAVGGGGQLEVIADPGTPNEEKLGGCVIPETGGPEDWRSLSLGIQRGRLAGRRTLALQFTASRAARVPGDDTTLWAQFKGVNPNEARVEMNVRPCVFYPSRPGLNYITVRGFELRQAATPWAGALSEQMGLIGTHWSKGWIIENNHIHHAVATGVTLGLREITPKPNGNSAGYLEGIHRALTDYGWSKENIGSHIVRNNHISHCEKNAIHGSLGACYSEISGNEIHDISVRGWITGPDIGGIKFLGGVDMVIRDNHIHRCGPLAAIWLDWMAQGALVTGNLLHDNEQDLFFEMLHGPLVSANNILLSKRSQLINSEGLALAHNLIAGATRNISDPRATPYHPAHALTIAGRFAACGGDHRVYNNLFGGAWNLLGKLPNVGSGNVYAGATKGLPFDTAPVAVPGFNLESTLARKADGWYLTLNANPAWRAAAKCKLITTEILGKAKVPGCAYENTDGTPLTIATDYFGNKRDPNHPFPGPFELVGEGRQILKVWPKSGQAVGPALSDPPSGTVTPDEAKQRVIPKPRDPGFGVWPDAAPADCPFPKSAEFGGIEFTGRHAAYTKADTWYPSWAADGHLYSPFTDGSVDGVGSHSAGKDAVTGNARIEGDDPLNLKVIPLGVHKAAPAPYGGRYPCGSLVHNDIWYYGTYGLDRKKDPWDIMGPFVGFRLSRDFGKTWTDTPRTPAKPLFGETAKGGGKVKMGSPHFVDFGKNMEHSPDGKAYLLGHGATRPGATCSWISGDQVYLARVTPNPENINDVRAYEFFSGHDAGGSPVWVKEFSKSKPLLEWNDRLGCVTATWNPALKRFLMCVTDGGESGMGTYDTLILESEKLTGPWKRVTQMQGFGVQGYFVNIPSKFIRDDGRTMWLCYSANWADVMRKTNTLAANPPGSAYAMCLQEFRLTPVKTTIHLNPEN